MADFSKMSDDENEGYDPALDDMVDEEHVARKVNRGASFVKFVLIVAILGGVGYGGFRLYQYLDEAYASKAYDLDLAGLKLQYLERERLVNVLDEKEAYVDARTSLLKWYFGELRKLEIKYARYPQFWDVDARLEDLREKEARGLVDSVKKERFDRAFALAREAYVTLRDGNFEPAISGLGGGVRLDFGRVGRQKVNGDDRLKADFYIFGMSEGISFGPIELEILNDKDNMFASMSGSGPPELLLRTPDSQIAQFPPGVAFGFYTFDLLPFPSVGLTLKLTYEGTTAASGQRKSWTYEFIDLPVQDNWKMGEDKEWDRSAADALEIDLEDPDRKKLSAKERMEAAVQEADRRAAEEAREKARGN